MNNDSCSGCKQLADIVLRLIPTIETGVFGTDTYYDKDILEELKRFKELTESKTERIICGLCYKGVLYNPQPNTVLKTIPPQYHVACSYGCARIEKSFTNYGSLSE